MAKRTYISSAAFYRIAICFVSFLCLFLSILPHSFSQDRCDQALDLGNGDCASFYNGFATADMGTGSMCITYENNLWYTFVAQEEITTVVLIPTFCVDNRGMDIEIFQANFCTIFDIPLACATTMGVSPISFELMTNIGETYYIIIDGNRGDICDFNLSLEHGECPMNPVLCDTLPTPILAGKDSICFGQGIFTYEILNYDPSAQYLWSIPNLSEFTDNGDGSITIDWSNWSGDGSPMVCVSQIDDRCRFAKACLSIFNTSFGFQLDPQTIRRCPHSFPITLIDYFNLLFVNQLIPIPPDVRIAFFISLDDLLNDVNEVTELTTPGDYTIWVALSRGDCLRVPLPADSAHLQTEYLDIQVAVDTFCEGGVFNFPFNVDVVEGNGYPGWPFDSLAFFTDGAEAASNVNRMSFPFPVTEDETFWARFNTTNGCSDTVSFNVDFVELPVFTAVSPDTMCSVLGNATYNLLSTPFTFSVGDIADMTFSFYRSEENAINDVNETPAVINATRTYYAVATNSFGCRSEPVPINVVFLISPYIEIFGNDDLCVGDSGEIVVTTVNSPVPFTLVIEDDFGNRDSIYGLQSSFFYYLPIFESTSFEIVDFFADAFVFCPYEAEANVDFDIIRLPLATIEVVTGCGDDAGVFFRASQNGDYVVHIHNRTSGETYVFAGELNNELLSIPVSNGDILVLDSFQHDSMCWSYEIFTTDEIVLTPPLDVLNIQIAPCDQISSNVTFDIAGGDEMSYFVGGLSGTFTDANTFQSDLLTSGTYNVFVTDDRMCDTVVFEVEIDCGCITEAGVISMLDSVLCENENTTIAISDTTLASGDLMQFILHDQPQPVVGTILQSSANGQFVFDPFTMNLNQEYYITMWVGVGQNGNVDTTSFCSVASNDIRVRWVDIPLVTVFDTLFLCHAPSDTTIRLSFEGIGPFTITYAIGGAMTGPVTTDDNFLDVELNGFSQNTQLIISDFHNEACDGIIEGNGNIIFIERPEFRNLIYTCAAAKDSFYFEVEIFGGTEPIILNGINGTLAGGVFTSVMLPSGFSSSLTMTDAFACEEIELLINRDCECESVPSSLLPDPLHLCADSIAVVGELIAAIIAPGDGQQFFIKDNNRLDTTGILSIQNTTQIVFDGSFMTFGTTYFIMPATSILGVGGNIDIAHKCFYPSVPIAFTFYDTPAANISSVPTALNCVVDEIVLDGSASYIPIGFQYEWIVVSGNINSGQNSLTPTVDQEGIYVLNIYNSLTTCNSEFRVEISENYTPSLANLEGGLLLNCENESSFLNGNMSSTGSDYNIYWSTADGNFVNTPAGLMAEVDAEGTYRLIVEHALSLCSDTAELFIDSNFDTPSSAISPGMRRLDCNVEDITLAMENQLLPEEVNSWYSSNDFVLIPNDNILISDPGRYYLIIENTISQCVDSIFVDIIEDIMSPELTLADSFFIDCIEDEATLAVAIDNMRPVNYAYSWISSGPPILTDPTQSQVLVNGAGMFSVEVTDESNGCESSEVTTVWALQEFITDLQMSFANSPCNEVDAGSLTISQIVGGTSPFLIQVDGQDVIEIPAVIQNLTAGEHQVTIQDINGCAFDSIFLISNMENVAVDLNGPYIVDEGNGLQILPTIEGQLDEFIFTIGDSTLSMIDQVNPTFFPLEDFVLSLSVMSSDGCVDSDDANIYVRLFYEIFVPTAFSPNADGINDVLSVLGPEKLDKLEYFQIYDRWGEKVFERFAVEANNDLFGWNGKINEQDAPLGVYVYKLKGVFKDGTERQISGEFTLVR